MKTSRWTMLVVAALAAAFTVLFTAAGASAAPGDPAPTSSDYNPPANGLQVGSNTVTQGSSVPVSGQGCTPNSTVSFSLDNGTPLGSTETDSNGSYATTVTIPSGTSVGSHTITSSGANCGDVADVSVTTSSSGSGGSGGGGLADTGVAVIGIGALGVVLLVGGGLMLLAGRRRRSAV